MLSARGKYFNYPMGLAALMVALFLLAVVVALRAQTPDSPTRLPDAQVAAPPTTFTAIQVVTPTGKVLVQPDASIVINLTATPPTIRAVTAAAVQERLERFVVSASGQNIFSVASAPATGTLLKVYRNGLLQWENVDYSVAGSTVTFLPAQGTAPGDYIQVVYRR